MAGTGTGRRAAVSYLRVSSKGQIAGDGLPRQRAAVQSYAKAHGLDLVAEFADEGVSGSTEGPARPGLAALLDRVESNGVRVVLVERADRLARDLMVSEWILCELAKADVEVICAADGTVLTDVATDDPTRRLIRQVLGAVAEFDKACIVLKLAAARARTRAATGRCEGRKPYGARSGERATIALIRKLRRKPRGRGKRAMSYAAVAAELNARSIPTRTEGAQWHAETVRLIHQRKGD